MSARSFLKRSSVALAVFVTAAALPLLAGDKIIFSDPSGKVGTSAPPAEEKSFMKPSLTPNLNSPQSPVPMNMAPPPVIGPIRRENRNKDKDWLSHDSKTDSEKDADAKDLPWWQSNNKRWERNSDSRKSSNGERNSDGQMRDERNGTRAGFDWDSFGKSSRSGPSSEFSFNERRGSSAAERNSVLSDLMTGSRSPLAESLRDEQLNRLNEFKSFYQMPDSTSPVGGASTFSNPLHDYNWQSSSQPASSAADLLPRRTENSFSRPSETRSFSAPDANARSIFAAPSNPNSYTPERGPVRAQSAVLPFPKRPGEVTP